MDKVPSPYSTSILFMLKDDLKNNTFATPAYKSEANGEVERFHSTLVEIMRLNSDWTARNFELLLEKSVNE